MRILSPQTLSSVTIFWVFGVVCVCVCVCMCVCVCVCISVYMLFIYTIFISIICVLQEKPKWIIFQKKIHCGK